MQSREVMMDRQREEYRRVTLSWCLHLLTLSLLSTTLTYNWLWGFHTCLQRYKHTQKELHATVCVGVIVNYRWWQQGHMLMYFCFFSSATIRGQPIRSLHIAHSDLSFCKSNGNVKEPECLDKNLNAWNTVYRDRNISAFDCWYLNLFLAYICSD